MIEYGDWSAYYQNSINRTIEHMKYYMKYKKIRSGKKMLNVMFSYWRYEMKHGFIYIKVEHSKICITLIIYAKETMKRAVMRSRYSLVSFYYESLKPI